MTTIRVFDCDAKSIDKIVEDYNLQDEAELIEWLIVAIENGDINLENILG